MSENRSAEYCDILFEYLRSILYDDEVRQPDLSDMDEPFRRLGEGLKYLQQAVGEMKRYSEDLSRGNLSGEFPPKENFLCANLKNLHANLNHLTWQAKQVAMGDYSQHVSYLGEFSDAFNIMIRQLKEREERLREEVGRTHRQMDVIEEYNELFVDTMLQRDEWIIVVDAATRQILYCNKQPGAEAGEKHPGDCASCSECRRRLSFLDDIIRWPEVEHHKVWNRQNDANGYFRITSFHIEWRKRNAYAHVVENVTEDKKEEARLASKAYFDAGTGIHNRFFFEEYMTQQLAAGCRLVFCFMDMDGLKYVNDNYGHNEGDCYIRRFVSSIRGSFRTTDMFARIGGDEFCLVLEGIGTGIIEQKMERLRDRFVRTNNKRYPVGFSYGLVEAGGPDETRTLKEIVEEADRRMYEYKKTHKVFPYPADDRLKPPEILTKGMEKQSKV